jgi:hypothetical protein
VTLTWQAGSGKTDHYVVFRDGTTVAPSVAATTYVDRPGNTTPHRYAVQAVNAKQRTSPQTSPVTAAAQVRELNDAERALLGKLPSTLVYSPSCEPLTGGVDSHLQLALTCDPGPGQSPSPPGRVPQALQVFSATDAVNLKAALDTEISSHDAASGSCSAVPQQGTWNFTETPKVVNGKIVCYTVGGTSSLLWSYDAQLIYVRAQTTNSYATLLKWWQGANLHLPG